MRNLVSYTTVLDVSPIPKADRIEVARVKGWDVVVGKGDFKAGDEVVYFEIDSALPLDDDRFSFLTPRGTRLFNNKSVHVLRTIRLRGQYSQGLILPASLFPELPEIEKWEPPLPTGSGEITGGFPLNWFPKTDSERIQNLGKFLPEILKGSWQPTEKIDGSSTSVVNTGEEVIVASRNWQVSDQDFRHTVLSKLGVLDNLQPGEGVQGEVFGEGIQKNPLNIKGHDFKAFSFYRDAVELPRDQWPDWVLDIAIPEYNLEMPKTADDFVQQATKIRSLINPAKEAEGVVWHGDRTYQFLGNRATFKAINNHYLEKHED